MTIHFTLVYSNVQSFDHIWGNTPNYLVTTQDIRAGWSDPIFLSNAGFDGSLFHDEDGRKWYTSLYLDEPNQNLFGGIMLQEFSEEEGRLVGESQLIFEGSELGITEGPHLYKIDGYYYLITAEGGTEYNHAVTVARSMDITGPYELSPFGPIICMADNPDWPLQKTGHGDLFEDGNGNWFIVFLTGRPLTRRGRCTLGRETAIEEIVWEDGWPKLKGPSNAPRAVIGVSQKSSLSNVHYDFLSDGLSNDWQSLRQPISSDWLRVGDEGLILTGRNSLASLEDQSVVARRIGHFNVRAETFLKMETGTGYSAGMIFYYNTNHYYYLKVTTEEDGRISLTIESNDKGTTTYSPNLFLPDSEVFLRGTFIGSEIRFHWSFDGDSWDHMADVALDGSILSDDYVQNADVKYTAAFTGAFVGLCCQGKAIHKSEASFEFFNYHENHD